VFASTRTNAAGLYEKPLNGSRDERPLLVDRAAVYPTSWSPDGRNLVFDRLDIEKTGTFEVWLLPADGRKAYPLIQSESSRSARFSPDGRWLAYGSTQSGSVDVFLTPFPSLSGRRQVSQTGGLNIRWRADGKELLYVDLNSRVTGVEITETAGGIDVGKTTTLFQMRPQDPVYAFDVSPDGQRFLISELPEQASSAAVLVTNWEATLRKR
jgi:Tol biopolymer transport system component